jgi:hypothetical protein
LIILHRPWKYPDPATLDELTASVKGLSNGIHQY